MGESGGAGSQGELRAELTSLDQELARLRRTVGELRDGIGGRGGGSIDPEERSADLVAFAEQQALLDILEQRRTRLLDKLDRYR